MSLRRLHSWSDSHIAGTAQTANTDGLRAFSCRASRRQLGVAITQIDFHDRPFGGKLQRGIIGQNRFRNRPAIQECAIFAMAGLKRIGLLPDNLLKLDWMLPAPAQGAVMIAALGKDTELLEICAELNDKETEICVGIEREFLNKLEGGC